MNLLHRTVADDSNFDQQRISLLLGKYRFDIDEGDAEGFPPLLLAARAMRGDTVRYLLDRGADRHAASDGGVRFLHMVAYGDLPFLVKRCLSEGDDVNMTNNRGNTPLHFALTNGHGRVAEMLLETGADPNRTNHKGERPVDMLRWTPVPPEMEEPFRELLRRYGATDV